MSSAVRHPPGAALKAMAARPRVPRIGASGFRRPKVYATDPKRDNPPPTTNGGETDGLLPEEDWTVPGGANDTLSSNTPLGRAVRSAADELEHLAQMEEEVLDDAYELLEKLVKRKSAADDRDSS